MRAARSPRAVYDALLTPSLAPYICSSCRQNAIRQSTPRPQQVRHASSSNLPWTEKMRRRIWGTDNPPGLKDPYGGPGFFGARRTAKHGAQTEDGMEELEQIPSEEQLEISNGSGPEVEAASEDYKPAETWDGLEHVGHGGDWRDEPPTSIDMYQPFVATRCQDTMTRSTLVLCLYQAIVEYYTVEGLNRSRPASVSRDFRPTEAIFRTRIVQSELGDIVTVQHASASDRKIILKSLRLSSPDEQTEVLAMLNSKVKAGELSSGNEIISSWEQLEQLSTTVEEENTEAIAQDGHVSVPIHEVPNEDFLDAPLNARLFRRSSATFEILKTFSVLTGLRIPDPILNSSKTARELLDHLCEQIKPKPKTVAETLMQKQELAGISNLKIMQRRETPVDKEKEVGRWKLIEAELNSRGLPVLGRART